MNDSNRRPQRNFQRGAERNPRPVSAEPVEENENQLEGRNAIGEALKAGRTIDKLFIASGDTDKGLQRLAAQAREAGAVVVPVDRRKLDLMSYTRSHQGVIALAAAHAYYTIDDILEEAASRGQNPLIVICDELSDPHNLGAILRSAECAGAHGVIIPKRRSVGLTATVAKASAGAVCGLLMIVGGEDAEDDGNVAVAIEQRNALSDALAYVVEMWCAAAYDASEDNDNVVGAAFDEL